MLQWSKWPPACVVLLEVATRVRNGNSNILARQMSVIHLSNNWLALLPSSPLMLKFCTNYYRDSAIART